MKLTKSQLTQMIKEEFESTYRPPVAQVIDLMEKFYDGADPDRKEWFEEELIKRFTELIQRWREGRENPSDTGSGY